MHDTVSMKTLPAATPDLEGIYDLYAGALYKLITDKTADTQTANEIFYNTFIFCLQKY
jgi:hypothetical protein